MDEPEDDDLLQFVLKFTAGLCKPEEEEEEDHDVFTAVMANLAAINTLLHQSQEDHATHTLCFTNLMEDHLVAINTLLPYKFTANEFTAVMANLAAISRHQQFATLAAISRHQHSI